MKLIIRFGLVIFALLPFCLSCNTSIRGTSLPSEITCEIKGEYMFTYNTGQVEILIMNLDSTYFKVVYPDRKSYTQKSDTLFYNAGKWLVDGKDIYFKDWLWCNDQSNKNTLSKESIKLDVSGVSWLKSEGDNPSSIVVFDEPYYEFKKVK